MNESDPNPSALPVPTKKGAPETRIKNAHQVWEICNELADQDKKRAKKRTRIFRAYNRFPPTDYSTLAPKVASWQSNVNFGMMAYVVDNNLSSFFDMLTERPAAARIVTKKGNPRERVEWGDHISSGFDLVLREWDEYLTNQEQCILDMLLYGKGVEMWDDEEGCVSEHISAEDILVPAGTKINFCNFDQFVIRRRYSMHELWKKLESGGAEDRGWNRKAVLSAMRHCRDDWTKATTDEEEFAKKISQGDITPGAHLKEYLDTYTLFIKEFKTDKISRYMVLKDYGPMFSLTRAAKAAQPLTDESKKGIIDKEGFLFAKPNSIEKVSDKLSVFMDCAGSGMWHQIPSLAEKVFVQCRQYDFSMNAIMDAVRINMSLMIQGQTPDATEKIKELVFGPYTIIPSDLPLVQQRFTLPTSEATQSLQFMMLDMFRGIGEYRVHEKGTGGEAPTATQSKLDAAESAKLSGTQLKRFNGQHSLYYRIFFKKLVTLKDGERDYELFKKFKDYLEDKGVPKEAWEFENIESISSNMLAGAGSPSYKLMAAEKTIELTNIAPKDAGQRKAVEDAIAALHGRDQVRRYIQETLPEPTFNEQKAGWENELLSNPLANPADIRVMPDDNHVAHVAAHLGDMQRTVALVNEGMESGKISEFVVQDAAYRLINQGAHVMGHFEFLKRDKTKQDMLKDATRRLSEIQGKADKISQDMKAMKDKKAADFDPASDPDIQKTVAKNALELNHQRQMMEISTGALAQKHQQRIQNDQEAAANKIAMERVKSATQTKKPKAPTPK